MPKNPATEILKRWRAMDKALGDLEGLHIPSFARQWRVSTKTVRRDLAAFRALGQRVACERDEVGRTVWNYEPGVERLFVSNLPRRLRERLAGRGQT
jgi:hypothetical protein